MAIDMDAVTPETTKKVQDEPAVAGVEHGGPETGVMVVAPPGKFVYESIPGYFVQTEGGKTVEFEPKLLDRSFGLLDTSPDRWANLDAAVRRLNAGARAEGRGVQYKVFFFGRHGQGWHNFGASKYGVDPWESYWTFLTGDGELVWGPDPELTPEGVRQARAVQAAWRREVQAGAPVSKELMRWYVSPLTRTGQTMLESFGDLLTGTPQVWEDWREIYGSHTCDLRSTKTAIHKRFPSFAIEEGFAEVDPLWKREERETDGSMQVRARRALDRIFTAGEADEAYISVTAHGAILRNTLAVLGHQPYPLATGEVVPVVVKATPTA